MLISRRQALGILMLAIPCAGHAFMGQDDVKPALQRLETVEIFAFGGVGYAGITSQSEKDYRVLISQPHEEAIKLLEVLYKEGNVQAKAYAFVGFRRLAPAMFTRLVNSPLFNTDVQTMETCIVDREKFQDLVNDIAKGKYDAYQVGTTPRQSTSPLPPRR